MINFDADISVITKLLCLAFLAFIYIHLIYFEHTHTGKTRLIGAMLHGLACAVPFLILTIIDIVERMLQ